MKDHAVVAATTLLAAALVVGSTAASASDPKTVAHCAKNNIDMNSACPYNKPRFDIGDTSELRMNDDTVLCSCSGQAITHGHKATSTTPQVDRERLVRISKVALASYDPGDRYASVGNMTNTSDTAFTSTVSWKFEIDNLVQAGAHCHESIHTTHLRFLVEASNCGIPVLHNI